MMATTVPLYALPLPTAKERTESKRSRKRKRHQTTPEEQSSEDETPSGAVEYSAVVTPEERAQRRLAGQPLDEDPPPFPFPHAPVPNKPVNHDEARPKVLPGNHATLRVQHLAVMTALLHKCLAVRDYVRALRALALILRTEVHGRTIDLRHAGLWGIGAELLFRLCSEPGSNNITRDGFEKAKLFYDRMSLQHPWHRSWPNAVNVQDFKIAYFGLWIYVVDQESKRLRQSESAETDENRELTGKEWELAEAEKIAREMDTLMGTLPFLDDPELIRLRANVALWTADLIDTVDGMRSEKVDSELELKKQWMGQEDSVQTSDISLTNARAENARAFAKNMFAKLQIQNNFEEADTTFG